jgi:hypothetical protein
MKSRNLFILAAVFCFFLAGLGVLNFFNLCLFHVYSTDQAQQQAITIDMMATVLLGAFGILCIIVAAKRQ